MKKHSLLLGVVPFRRKGGCSPLSSDAGFAIGPLLFALSLIGLLATVLSVGTGSFGSAGITDRVSSDIVSQANLIRAKINECNILYGTKNNGDGWPSTSYVVGGLRVSDLYCTAEAASIWSGNRAASLPGPVSGFSDWRYINAGDSGGRCIWTQPSSVSSAVIKGLKSAARKFSSQEVAYDPEGTSQRFVVFVTIPTGTVNSYCMSE